jgi:EAL domain-containing protein (putative c-di-GMP-specific phosphodiesterase class I)
MRVQLLLAKYQVPASSIELELTESAIMDRSGMATAQLSVLAAAGIRLAIDDFGTGYSSLSYLEDVPASVVKIDQSFIRKLDTADGDDTLVRSMIGLFQDLGFRVVAEGVETEGVLQKLRSMKCDEAQGFLFSRPAETPAFEDWVRSSEARVRFAA